MILVPPFIRIPDSELEISYARSSGPGGQNVNKVNSKAILRWNLVSSPSLSPGVRDRLRARLEHRLTTEGDLLIMSDRFRDQGRNREDCLEKLRELLAAAAAVPKFRRESRPSRSSIRKAKEAKGRHSQKKKLRRSFRPED